MGLNIKKANYINTSDIKSNDYDKSLTDLNESHPFIVFKKSLENSWIKKNLDLANGDKLQYEFNNYKDNLNIIVDSLKIESLITYVDAPWGSGKTRFIEELIRWIKKCEAKKDFFQLAKNNSEKEMNISVIDAWSIYTSSNIDETLREIYEPSLNDDFIKKYKSIKNSHKNNSKENLKKTNNKKMFLKTAAVASIVFSTIPNPLQQFSKSLSNLIEKKKNEFDFEIDNIEKLIYDDRLIFSETIFKLIEKEFKNNNNLIIIDNIERLSSKNRLDVINKILNWASLKGTTFLFLTNFEKINFTKLEEEDFWNKISLYETFKLTNSWQKYLENYEHNGFKLCEYENLINLIKYIIPSFFSSNNDDMDIREIKKLLDNWNKDLNNELNLIKSFTKELIEKNSWGLDKYFLINKLVDWLSENAWELWKDTNFGSIKKYLNFKYDADENIPLINNKMYRIQSNFYDLKIWNKKSSEIEFVSKDIKMHEKDLPHFKSFNNFIDDYATESFKKIIDTVLITRKINDKKNYLYKYLKWSGKKEVKYFEFKYNNIKKLHIYNDIFG